MEGKIIFSTEARRLANFLVNKNYMDASVKKEGISKEPGCIEHMGVIAQNKGDLAVVWLD